MTEHQKIRLVVLYGGRSAEHEVSCVTAVHVLKALDPDRYDVVPIGITAEGRWLLDEATLTALKSGSAGLPRALEAAGREVSPFSPVVQATEENTPIVFLPLLHGPFGEDGTVQGMLEVAGVPYVGAGVLGSALAMDKAKAKEVLGAHGLPQGGWLGVHEDELGPRLRDRVARELGWPVFVKPANLGSSVGVSKVADGEALERALDLAFSYDEWVVVEEAVVGREIEVAVLGNRDPEASVPGEIVPSREFYDYEDKYLVDGARLVIPAPLSPAATDEVRALALEVFAVLRAEGMARVDFFYEEDRRGFLVNEANTIPGFTPISMYPKLWEASGLPYPKLVDRLVELALERHARRANRIGRRRATGGRPGR
jgi:D-alanine-D-alanine ligase